MYVYLQVRGGDFAQHVYEQFCGRLRRYDFHHGRRYRSTVQQYVPEYQRTYPVIVFEHLKFFSMSGKKAVTIGGSKGAPGLERIFSFVEVFKQMLAEL